MKYQFISDPSHGWLQVPVTEYIKAIRDGVHISDYSYASIETGMVYLEEDDDAVNYITWYKDRNGQPLVYDIQHYDDDCFIRELPSLVAQN